MYIDMCKWCGDEMYVNKEVLGCEMICDLCIEAELIAAEESEETHYA